MRTIVLQITRKVTWEFKERDRETRWKECEREMVSSWEGENLYKNPLWKYTHTSPQFSEKKKQIKKKTNKHTNKTEFTNEKRNNVTFKHYWKQQKKLQKKAKIVKKKCDNYVKKKKKRSQDGLLKPRKTLFKVSYVTISCKYKSDILF